MTKKLKLEIIEICCKTVIGKKKSSKYNKTAYLLIQDLFNAISDKPVSKGFVCVMILDYCNRNGLTTK